VLQALKAETLLQLVVATAVDLAVLVVVLTKMIAAVTIVVLQVAVEEVEYSLVSAV
jgi:hypothetical protein